MAPKNNKLQTPPGVKSPDILGATQGQSTTDAFSTMREPRPQISDSDNEEKGINTLSPTDSTDQKGKDPLKGQGSTLATSYRTPSSAGSSRDGRSATRKDDRKRGIEPTNENGRSDNTADTAAMIAEAVFKALGGNRPARPLVSPPARFTGRNISHFLKRFDLYMDNTGISENDRADWLHEYVDEAAWSTIRFLTEDGDWVKVKIELRRIFRDHDGDQQEAFEVQLDNLNRIRLQDDYHIITDHLIKHKYLWKKVGMAEPSQIHTRHLYSSMPDSIVSNLGLKLNKRQAQLKEMTYLDFHGHLTTLLEDRRELETRDGQGKMQTTQAKRVLFDPSVVSKSLSRGSDQYDEKKTKGQANLGSFDQMQELLSEMKHLNINALKRNAVEDELVSVMRMLKRDLDREPGNTRAIQPREILSRSNTVRLASDESNWNENSAEEEYVSVNAYRGGSDNIRCFYCNRQGHHPATCEGLKHDVKLKFSTYDWVGRAAWFGNREWLLPPSLVARFEKISGIRKLLVIYCSRFPKSHWYALLPKIKASSADTLWEPTSQETEILDRFWERASRDQQEGIDEWRVPTSIRSDESRLPIQDVRGTSHMRGPHTSMVTIDEDDNNHLFTNAMAVAVNSNERKRMRSNEAGHAVDTSGQQEPVAPVDEISVSREDLGTAPAASRTDRALLLMKLQDEILGKKFGMTLQDIFRLAPEVAEKLGKEFLGIQNTYLPNAKVEYVPHDLPNPAENGEGSFANRMVRVQENPVPKNKIERETRPQTQDERDRNPKTSEELQINNLEYGEYLTVSDQMLGDIPELTRTLVLDPASFAGSFQELGGVLRDEEKTRQDTTWTRLDTSRLPANSLATLDKGRLNDGSLETKLQPHNQEPRTVRETVKVRQDWNVLAQDLHQGTIDQMVSANSVVFNGRVLGLRQSLPHIPVRVNDPVGDPIEALVDTGSEGNIISLSLAKQCNLKIKETRSVTTSFSNDRVQLLGVAWIKLYLGNVWIDQCVYVAPPEKISTPFLLGMPFIRSAQVSFDHKGPSGNLILNALFSNVRVYTPTAGSMHWKAADPHIDEDVMASVRVTSCNFSDHEAAFELQPDERAVGCSEEDYMRVVKQVAAHHLHEFALVKEEEARNIRKRHLLARKEERRPVQGQRSTFDQMIQQYPREKRDSTGDIHTNTLFKRKGVKVQPVDNEPSDGSTPDGDPLWKEKRWKEAQANITESRFDKWVVPRFSTMLEGSRLTPTRLQGLIDQVKETLREEEREIFVEILQNREAALAWDFSECGSLDPLVAPPQVIRTIDHSAWQANSIPIPVGMKSKVIDHLKQKMERGLLEEGHSAYRNPFFLVMKKDGGVRLINSATKLNAITQRDALQPPGADEFSEDFAMCKMLSLLDFFSGYDQVPLDRRSRDLTTFSTPIGLLRMCTLPQGATNSVAQFMRIMIRILFDLIPQVCRPFLDDITVRGPVSTYNNEEAAPGVRKYVLEHLINLDKVLLNVELAGCTISVAKSQFCRPQALIVGYLCGTYGRKPEEAKVIKIKEWERCTSTMEVRSFLGMSGFYRSWCEHIAWVARPLYDLLKKDTVFRWTRVEQDAMDSIKCLLTTAPTLVTLSTEPEAGEVVLMVDASLKGWGACLLQVVDGVRKPVRYESGCWSKAEQGYDATKRECKGILSAFRRLRAHLYGWHFTLETDAQVLTHQLRGSAADVPGSLIMRWLSYIQLFDFTVKHIPGKSNPIADALSRKPSGPSDQLDSEIEGDGEAFIDIHLNTVSILDPEEKYSEKHERLAAYLHTWERPASMNAQQFRVLRKSAQHYRLLEGKLWRKPRKDHDQPTLVIDDLVRRKQLIKSMHVLQGHKGRDVTFNYLRIRYWWPSMWNDVSIAISCCEWCQKFAPWKEREGAISTEPGAPMTKVHFDSQYMPKDGPYLFLMEARCDCTGWVEAEAVPAANSRNMIRFIRRLVYRFGVMIFAVVDGGPEMKADLPRILEDWGTKVIVTSKYNPRANGIVEAGHWSIISALAKTAQGNYKWFRNLDAALLADRTAVRNSHGYSPFQLIYGWQPLLPIEVEFPTWRLINWTATTNQEDYLNARIRMLQRKGEDVALAQRKVTAFRKKLATRTDKSHKRRVRDTSLQAGDLVLAFDNRVAGDLSREAKMKMRWHGPYLIKSCSPHTGSYRLETPYKAEIQGTFAADQLKRFIRVNGWWETEDEKSSQAKGVRAAPVLHSYYNDSSSSASDYEDDSSNATDSDEDASPGANTASPAAPTLQILLPRMSDKRKAQYSSVD